MERFAQLLPADWCGARIPGSDRVPADARQERRGIPETPDFPGPAGRVALFGGHGQWIGSRYIRVLCLFYLPVPSVFFGFVLFPGSGHGLVRGFTQDAGNERPGEHSRQEQF